MFDQDDDYKYFAKEGAAGPAAGRVQRAVNAAHLPLLRLTEDDDWGPITTRGLHALREWALRDSLLTEEELTRLEALGAAYEAGRTRRDQNPEWTPPAKDYDEMRRVYGDFQHRPRPGQPGWIDVVSSDENYAFENPDLPIVGKEWVHAKVVGPLTAFLEIVEDMGRADAIGDNIGTLARRHIGRNTRKRLSIHTWGIAFDVKPRENRMGRRGFVDPFVVQVARGLGFVWGGTWGSTSADRTKGLDGNTMLNERRCLGTGKDDMHFEWFAGNALGRVEE